MPAGGSKIKGVEVNQRFQNKQGQWFTVKVINNCKDVLICFDNGYLKTTTTSYIKRGVVYLPKNIVGDIHYDKKGNKVTITNIGSNKVTLQWEDGYEREFQQSVLVTKQIIKECESRTLNPSVQVGRHFETNQGCLVEVVELLGNSRCLVRFDQPFTFIKEAQKGNVRDGNIHNQYLPTVAGFGILGDFKVDCTSKMYRSWVGMLKRVYKPRKSGIINYAGCSVSEEWRLIENFNLWFKEQMVEDDWELDKDLLIKGNKEYSSKSCVFLPREVNCFMTDRYNHRGEWPLGVTYHPRIKKWQATCNFDSSPNYLGVFLSPEAAFNAYKLAKEGFARDLANRWEGRIDKRAVDALNNFEVLITD